MPGEPLHVAVVGGGISGLATAYRLLVSAGDRPVRVTLIEATDRLGGIIRTERHDGFLVDAGPDSFVVTKPRALALCRELGLGERLIQTTPANRRVYVANRGRLVPMPEGLALGIPTRFTPMLRTPLLSWRAKARLALDLAIPRRSSDGDESIGSFIRRRLGREAAEIIAEPLLAGIYAGDVDALSARTTFPQLVALEARHGSLVLGALAERRAQGRAATAPAPSPFRSLPGGMGELVAALEGAIVSRDGTVRLGTRVDAIAHVQGGGFELRTTSSDGAASTIAADRVALTLPAKRAAVALGSLDDAMSRELGAIPFLSTGTVVLGFARSDVAHALDASGFVVPRSERLRILAATFISSKWTGRAAERTVLVRAFVGGHRDPGALALADDELVALARDQVGGLLGVTAPPSFTKVFRFEGANAQPTIGHAERVGRIRALAARHPGLDLAGAALGAVGIPDCVREGEEAAARLLSG